MEEGRPVLWPPQSHAADLRKSKCFCPRRFRTSIATRFFRFLVLLIKNTQHAPKRAYSFVPMQDFSEPWTDEKLYAKYGITDDEIAFIESMIRPMEGVGANSKGTDAT